MADIQVNLICCTATMVHEISMREFKQKDVALTYAMALKSQHQGADTPDWEKINGAILSRWSMSGLERIKKRAWDILAGKVKP